MQQRDDTPLRIALTSYRSKPHSGGQGVYVRNLSRELVALGHSVEVFSGQPYPDLDAGVGLTKVPGLNLYDDADPFRRPARDEFHSATDVLEYLTMCTAGFPEPRTFSRRVVPLLHRRRAEFDVVHDNQTLGPAFLRLPPGLPLVGTIHHPISVDRALDLAAAPTWQKRVSLRRWYGFVGMQARVARRLDLLVSPSQNSVDDAIRDFGVAPDRFRVVPVGVDVEHFRPRGERVPGRIVTMCSADVPLKGLSVLLHAMTRLPAATLTVVSKPEPGGRTEKLVAELGLGHRVTFVSGLTDDALADLLASAEVACVPSLYEGFSLPAVEAMASGTPLVASDAGALPEVVGRDGRCGTLVPAADPVALAGALADLLASPERRAAMGVAARERAATRFSWAACARATADVYREAIARTSSSGDR